MDNLVTCRYCQGTITFADYFCPNCGKKLREKPVSTTLSRQIVIYLISALLPPLGLWPAIKYLRQTDDKAKQIGLVAIVITIISTLVTVWFTFYLINYFNQIVGSQLGSYEGLGF